MSEFSRNQSIRTNHSSLANLTCAVPTLVLFASVLFASGCKPASPAGPTTGGATPASYGSASSPTSGDTIVIGEYGSLTGDSSSFGIQTDAGIKIAQDEINAAGGIENGGKKYKVEIAVEDDAGTTAGAETAVKRLIDEKHVTAMLGEVASSLSIAGGKICQQDGIPMISPSSTRDSVTQIGDDIFRVCFLDSYQAAVDARFAIDGLKAKKAAVFTNKDQAYSTGFRDEFTKAFVKYGGTIVMQQTYSQDDPDYRAQLTALKASNPDVILVPGYYKDASTVVKQARELGITIPLLGGDGWSAAELLKFGGKAMDGCYFSDHMSISDPKPIVQQFVNAYKTKFGSDSKMQKEPSTMAALGYDAAKIMFEAIARAKSLNKNDIRDAIAATKDYVGVTGNITINKDRNADKSAVIIAIKDGKFTYQCTVPNPDLPLKL